MRCPVAHSNAHGGFGLVTRYGDVDAVARDWEHFSSASGIAIPAALARRRRTRLFDFPCVVDDATAISVSMSLIFAGLETSAASITTSAYELARRPELRRRLVDEPSLLPSAVKELLRFTSPVAWIGRTVAADTAVGAQDLAAGNDRFRGYEIAGPVLWGFGENRGVRSLPVSTAPSGS